MSLEQQAISATVAAGAAIVAARLAYISDAPRLIIAGIAAATVGALADLLAPTASLYARDVLIGGAIAWSIDDAATGLIHHRLTVPLGLLCLTLGALELGPAQSLGGALLCATSFAIPKLLSRKRAGLGGGDLLASTSIGAALGLQGGIAAIIVGGTLALVVTFVFVGFRLVQPGTRLRLGPYLALGALSIAATPLLTLFNRIFAIAPT